MPLGSLNAKASAVMPVLPFRPSLPVPYLPAGQRTPGDQLQLLGLVRVGAGLDEPFPGPLVVSGAVFVEPRYSGDALGIYRYRGRARPLDV